MPNRQPLFPIVFEDDQLLVINKPAGLVCHPTKGDANSSLVGRVRQYLGRTGHLANRLDRETSGLVLVAKSREMAGRLGRAWGARDVRKHYHAIVHGWVRVETGMISAPLGKDVSARTAIKDCVRADGAAAVTHYRLLKRFDRAEGRFSLLAVEPETGRKHQIRIHLAHLGHPIVGDKLYGGDEQLYLDFVSGRLTPAQQQRLILVCHALHALRVTIPLDGGTREFWAEPAQAFREFCDWHPAADAA
jgi:23S rRNA pseudouridine1911/1915/1917 synthase